MGYDESKTDVMTLSLEWKFHEAKLTPWRLSREARPVPWVLRGSPQTAPWRYRGGAAVPWYSIEISMPVPRSMGT